jgi:hypothetical protein
MMTLDGRPDSERNQYNVAGVQVANPQNKGDISVGGDTLDPTGRAIAVNLSTGSATDGQILTVQKNAATGLSWADAPDATVTGTPNSIAAFDNSGVIESSFVQVEAGHTLKIAATSPTVSLSRDDNASIIELNASAPGSSSAGLSQTVQSVGNNNRLTINGAVTAQRQSNLLNNFDVSGVYVRGAGSDGLSSNNKVLSQHAIAYFDQGSDVSKVGQVVVLPSLTSTQRDNLVTDLDSEYKAWTSLNTSAEKLHSNTSTSDAFIDNGMFFCRDDNRYYVLRLTATGPSVRQVLTDEDAQSQVVVAEVQLSVLLSSLNTQDYEQSGFLSFGQVLKIEGELQSNATLPDPAQLQITFYNNPLRRAQDTIETVDLIINTSGPSFIHPSITTEDTQGGTAVYVRVSNLSTDTVSAVIKLKGMGSV